MAEFLTTDKRTHYCGNLDASLIGQDVVLMGWTHRRRDHGGVIFVDLRDREGMVQVVFNPDNAKAHKEAHRIRSEFVLAVKGKVRRRPDGMENPSLKSGEVEVLVSDLDIMNESKTPPFSFDDEEISENIRLKYRYLDLRRPAIQKNLFLRSRMAAAARRYFEENGFIEVETPFLGKSTPEGARDYLVPSRIYKGMFYALPQSPQIFKQLLMISGFDRYYQIVKCFRDEDLRADRQPEFTQIDVEMSFVEEEDVLQSTEEMLIRVFREVAGINLESPFPRIPYDEAMGQYGSDKPDLRFGYEIHTLDKIVERGEFEVFNKALASGGTVAGICFPQGASITRKLIDELTEQVKKMGVQGLAFTRVTANGLEGGIARFLTPVAREIIAEFDANDGDIIFFSADSREKTYSALGVLRLEIAKRLQLIPANVFKPVWVTRFPLLEWSAEENRLVAMHHPFTAAVPEEAELLATNPAQVHARAYDIVINGHEIGGGSIRNHTVEMQKRMFDVLQINPETAQEKFGFLLEALSYGAPPHGGIALGFDRLVMVLAGAENLREVIAFPKT
ncbi:MAG: aspartate--tRNA ligase, partial [Deltaproteobacteria bacterium]|nr:aspartate--tRNA ligase [Deltaproteobacteria bacterium]